MWNKLVYASLIASLSLTLTERISQEPAFALPPPPQGCTNQTHSTQVLPRDIAANHIEIKTIINYNNRARQCVALIIQVCKTSVRASRYIHFLRS
jgi:hypothetical protein